MWLGHRASPVEALTKDNTHPVPKLVTHQMPQPMPSSLAFYPLATFPSQNLSHACCAHDAARSKGGQPCGKHAAQVKSHVRMTSRMQERTAARSPSLTHGPLQTLTLTTASHWPFTHTHGHTHHTSPPHQLQPQCAVVRSSIRMLMKQQRPLGRSAGPNRRALAVRASLGRRELLVGTAGAGLLLAQGGEPLGRWGLG